MPWVEANGANLRYELGGSGNETLVLLHEAGGCLDSYDEAVPGLAKEFRVLRYDQRGFGFSEKLRKMASDTVAADLAGLLDALQISTPVYLAGCAMGADFAVGFSARYPKRVAKLAIASPAFAASPANRARILERADQMERDGVRAVMMDSHERSYPENLRALDRERFKRYQARWVCNDPESFAALGRLSSAVDLTPDYAKIQAPTLVIGARYDALRTPELAERVANAIAGAQYVLADTGHFMALQTPQLFVDMVLPFFKGN